MKHTTNDNNISNNSNSNINQKNVTNSNNAYTIFGDNNTIVTDKTTSLKPEYKATPVWRSEITQAALGWISLFLTLFDMFKIYKVFEPFFSKDKIDLSSFNDLTFLYKIFIISVLALLFYFLWRTVKKELRVPIGFNYAINGKGKKLTIEKFEIQSCPICGGAMKFYNKPEDYRKYYENGIEKYEVIKRKAVFECKRNSKHCFDFDPTDND